MYQYSLIPPPPWICRNSIQHAAAFPDHVNHQQQGFSCNRWVCRVAWAAGRLVERNHG